MEFDPVKNRIIVKNVNSTKYDGDHLVIVKLTDEHNKYKFYTFTVTIKVLVVEDLSDVEDLSEFEKKAEGNKTSSFKGVVIPDV